MPTLEGDDSEDREAHNFEANVVPEASINGTATGLTNDNMLSNNVVQLPKMLSPSLRVPPKAPLVFPKVQSRNHSPEQNP